MKKLLVLAIAFSAVVSCKKEAENGVTTTKTDSSTTSKKVDEAVAKSSPASLKEFSEAQVSEHLKSKQNDTLYITNFFATWCGPCMKEIPEFKAKMEELKGKPVKFTFVSLDDKTDWNEAVKNFADEHGLHKNIVLLDGANLKPEFFTTNFKTWKGETIPFTILKKGDKSEEIEGSMSKEMLDEKINAFK